MASGYRIRHEPDTPCGMSGPMLELISDSRSLLVGDLLGSVSSLAGLGGNFLGLVGLGEIAFLASLFGALGGSLVIQGRPEAVAAASAAFSASSATALAAVFSAAFTTAFFSTFSMTSSMRIRGALSPLRLPTRMRRV